MTLDAFHQLQPSFGLIGSSTCSNQSFGFPKEVENRGLTLYSTIYTLPFWIQIKHWLVTDLHPTLFKVAPFNCTNNFVIVLWLYL